jgi:hypothetical protein
MKGAKNIDNIYIEAKNIVENGRKAAYHAVNASMVRTYWELGQLIVEEEQ